MINKRRLEPTLTLPYLYFLLMASPAMPISLPSHLLETCINQHLFSIQLHIFQKEMNSSITFIVPRL